MYNLDVEKAPGGGRGGICGHVFRHGRAWEHREGIADGFTARYEEIRTAIQREKNLKHWPRAWKVKLILADNPNWDDLYERLA